MSSDDQAKAYIEEARLTLDSARAIFQAAQKGQSDMWAQVVKNGYDGIEQAVSAGIAARGERIPRQHPAKITVFLDLYDPPKDLSDDILYWLRRRGESQYVDIRGNDINVPHEQFIQEDAERILEEATTVLEYIEDKLSASGHR